MKEIKQIKIKKGMKINELIKEFKETGVGAKKLGEAADVLELMIKDKKCKKFLGIAGVLVPAGFKEIIMDLLEHINVLVITGANLTHDLINELGGKHYQGDENVDDKELNEKGLDRIYNVFLDNKSYIKLEEFFEKNFDKLKEAKNIREFLWKLGEISPKNTILRRCYEKKIPVFCPAIADSGIGLMIWGQLVKNKKINIDAFDDLREIINISWGSKKNGVIYINGGVPKNYIQQALQFSKGADYGLQITLAKIEDGGSSGAELKEGISWGKLNKNAKFVDLRCDSTIALPLIIAALKDRI